MSANSPNIIILKSLYRSILKQCRIIDQSPIHKCFLTAKPKRIYDHYYSSSMNIKLSSSDFEVVEKILNDHCGGEYFEPAYPGQELKSLSKLTKHLFRYGIPSKYYDPNYILDKNKSDNELLTNNLQKAFYAKKRLSHSTNLINKIPFELQTKYLNAFNNDPQTQTTSSVSGTGAKFEKMPLTSDISIKSLTPIHFKPYAPTPSGSQDNDDNNTDNPDVFASSSSSSSCNIIERGTILLSHPLGCVSQVELHRRLIYIIESSPDRIVGIVMNFAHSLFEDTAIKPQSSSSSRNRDRKASKLSSKSIKSGSIKSGNSQNQNFQYCFEGWRGEYNYIGGPVNDQNFPFCILHDNDIFYDKFKEFSTILIDRHADEYKSDNLDKTTYWTWVTQENYEQIYNNLNQITDGIKYNELNTKNKKIESQSEISGNVENDIDVADNVPGTEKIVSIDDAQVVNGDDGVDDGVGGTVNEYMDSLRASNDFKFYQCYAVWNPDQLLIELDNNVWFPCKLNDINEEQQLLHLKCPSNKLLKQQSNSKPKLKYDYKKTFNKWMWQVFIRQLGNEFIHLSLFPELSNELVKEYYEFITEFHSSWVPDQSITDDDDEHEEEDGTQW